MQAPPSAISTSAASGVKFVAPQLDQSFNPTGNLTRGNGLAAGSRPLPIRTTVSSGASSSPRRRRLFLHHTGVFEHVCPLPASACVAVFEVLAEVVGPVELLARVALAELVHVLKMPDAIFPFLIRRADSALALPGPGEFLPAVSANVSFAGPGSAIVERPLIARQRRARPTVPPNMERILVPLGFVLVLEAVSAE